MVRDTEHAERLLRQIGQYLPEAHIQSFRPSPHLKTFQPSPWELISHDMTSAVLAIAANHSSLHELVFSYIWQALEALTLHGNKKARTQNNSPQVDDEQALEDAAAAIKHCLSLLGVLTALVEQASACSVSERYSIVQRLHEILSKPSMVKLEGFLSSVRNSSSQARLVRPWRRLLRAYASAGRTLGAVLLQQAFMRFVTSSTALFVAAPSSASYSHVLDFLLGDGSPPKALPDACGDAILEGLTTTVTDSVGYVDADADFLRVTSPYQQRLSLIHI